MQVICTMTILNFLFAPIRAPKHELFNLQQSLGVRQKAEKGHFDHLGLCHHLHEHTAAAVEVKLIQRLVMCSVFYSNFPMKCDVHSCKIKHL